MAVIGQGPSRRTSFLTAAIVVVAAGLLVALAFERAYDVRIRMRPPDPLAMGTAVRVDASGQPDASGRAALPLRLVEIGGVGIALDGWGRTCYDGRRSVCAV